MAAGVEQSLDEGLLISGPLDGDGPSDFTVSAVGADCDEPTWMRGACRSGELLVGVGEFSQREAGLLLFSDDGGASWVDRTDELDAPSLHRCRIFADGSVAVAGQDGYFARLNRGGRWRADRTCRSDIATGDVPCKRGVWSWGLV